MESYQFYKSLYDRELNRRKDLDSAVNLPITILSILVAANLYLIDILGSIEQTYIILISNISLFLVVLSFLTSIFFLTRSYNNLFKGFGYRNLAYSQDIRKYEKQTLEYNEKQIDIDKKINFENIIIDKLTELTDSHIIFNDKRSLDVYKAKTFIIITLILTGIRFLVIIF